MMLLKEVNQGTLKGFLNESVRLIASSFELSADLGQIVSVLEKETVQFQKTITNGQKLLRELFAHQKK
jgi:alanyl-tRNA synthetase